MADRKCLQCFEQLRGRTDQKFCNDQCRGSYNNRQRIESKYVIRTINRILKKNYLILTSMTTEGKTTTNRSVLENKGYHFEYFTCALVKSNSKASYFCYDQGYKELENNKVIFVRPEMYEFCNLISKLCNV
jgi:predicted glycosyl hydrolase (DUF1957 family)